MNECIPGRPAGPRTKFLPLPATQIGFEDLNECPHLCALSYDYLKKTEGYEQNLLAFFHNKMNPDALLVQLIEEMDKCILGYFSFHWKYATHIITQVYYITQVLLVILYNNY